MDRRCGAVDEPCQTAVRRSADSPDGYCVMAVAENRQTVDFLQVRSAPDPDPAPSVDPSSAVARFPALTPFVLISCTWLVRNTISDT
jgi:hypothetical protein